MDSFELNKIAGVFLGTVFVVMTLGLASDALYSVHEPETQGFAIVAAEGSAPAAAEAEEEVWPVISPLLASADPAAGAGVFKKCASCHTIEEGGANKVGPNLWNIVNRPVASHEGFKYSGALTEYASTGAVWEYENLNKYVHAPKDYVSGTTMGFAGIKREQELADLIVYLREQSPSPAPLP